VGDYRITVLGVLLLVYVTTARYILVQHTRVNAVALAAPQEWTDADTLASNRRWGLLPGLIGIALTFLIAGDISERELEWTRDYWILPHLFNWLWCIPFGWVGGRFLFALGANGLAVSKLAQEKTLDSVFDASSLSAAVEQSNISALLMVLFLGGLAVHFVDPGAGYVSVMLLLFIFFWGFVFSYIAAVGATKNIRLVRRRELEMLQSQLHEMEKATLSGSAQSTDRLQNLLLLESRIKAHRTGVFQVSSFAKGAFYAALGLLSWLGAATVERILDYFLG